MLRRNPRRGDVVAHAGRRGDDSARFELAQPREYSVARKAVILAEFVDRGYPVAFLEPTFGDAVDDEVHDLFVFGFVVFHCVELPR